MSALQRKTPARLTEVTARKLPRWALLLVGLTYLYAGLFFRDAWKTDDAVGMATILSTYNDGFKYWLTPLIGHFAYAQEGPLLAWIGSASIYIFSPIFGLFLSPLDAQIAAAKIPNFLYFFLLLWAAWYGSYLLARRKECKPLTLPFGGEPNPADYGRMLSDCAFLFVIASFGIVIRMHETSTVPLIIAMHALGFYGLVRMLDLPNQGTALLILGLSGAVFARGLIGVTPLLITVLACLFYKGYRSRQKLSIVFSLFVSALLLYIWTNAAESSNPYWLRSWYHWNTSSFIPNNLNGFGSSLRNLLWFAWPAWPFALVALWNWRQWLTAPHIFLPMMLLIGNLLTLLLLVDAFEPEYGPIIVPVAVLAAMSIPTLRRSVINALDWFSIMIVSLVMLSIWLGWFALSFGWPSKINFNIMRLIQGFDIQINWLNILGGLVISVFWAWLICWRLHLKPQALWRGLILSAGGLTCAWILLVLLWQPAINYNRSYQDVAQSLAQAIQDNVRPGQCVRAHGLGSGQRALFYMYGKIDFQFDKSCPWVLLQTNKKLVEDKLSPYADNIVKWQGTRISDRHGELFQLILVK